MRQIPSHGSWRKLAQVLLQAQRIDSSWPRNPHGNRRTDLLAPMRRAGETETGPGGGAGFRGPLGRHEQSI
jgi:hypothetical protein